MWNCSMGMGVRRWIPSGNGRFGQNSLVKVIKEGHIEALARLLACMPYE